MLLSGKADIKEALEKTLDMWNEIAENPQINKIMALNALCYDDSIYSQCYLCEYVVINFGFDTTKGFSFPMCDYCPVKWKEVNIVENKKTPQCLKSYFGLWIEAYKKYLITKDSNTLKSLRLLAIKIASLMEEKLDEIER